MPPKRTYNFRLDARQLFLTYPQCPMSKEAALEALKEKFPKWTYICVSRELHEDGNPHLHAYLELSQRTSFYDARFADLGSQHGKYERAAKPANALEYVKKDRDFVSTGADPLFEEPKEKVTDLVALRILDGEDLSTLVKEQTFPGSMMMNLKKIQDYENYVRSLSGPKEVLKEFAWTMSPVIRPIQEWIKKNLIIGCSGETPTRKLRQKQLFLWGPPKMGKSTLIEILAKCFETYFMPHMSSNSVFVCGWNRKIKLVIFDEFFSSFPVSFMNQFLCGQHMRLNTKGGSVMKTINPAIIVCSNDDPKSMYPNCSDRVREAFLSRFKIVYVDEFLKVF